MLGVDPRYYLTVDDRTERVALDAAVRRAWEMRTDRDEQLVKATATRTANELGRIIARMFR